MLGGSAAWENVDSTEGNYIINKKVVFLYGILLHHSSILALLTTSELGYT